MNVSSLSAKHQKSRSPRVDKNVFCIYSPFCSAYSSLCVPNRICRTPSTLEYTFNKLIWLAKQIKSKHTRDKRCGRLLFRHAGANWVDARGPIYVSTLIHFIHSSNPSKLCLQIFATASKRRHLRKTACSYVQMGDVWWRYIVWARRRQDNRTMIRWLCGCVCASRFTNHNPVASSRHSRPTHPAQ